MNYEKKYKEALERAKKLYEQGTITESLGYVFPELKEGEDERIRNFLIDFIKVCTWTEKKDQGWPSREDCLAWLEKQGENNKLDADKVIAWLVANILDYEYYVKLFKKDFGL